MPTAVGNYGMLEYIWDSGGHQPAHSQSLRLGNQSISGDSKALLRPLRLTRFGLWFRMDNSSISRSRRSSIMCNCKSKFLFCLWLGTIFGFYMELKRVCSMIEYVHECIKFYIKLYVNSVMYRIL